jgi:hypothetical protein
MLNPFDVEPTRQMGDALTTATRQPVKGVEPLDQTE